MLNQYFEYELLREMGIPIYLKVDQFLEKEITKFWK
jgi:hypothetical protein